MWLIVRQLPMKTGWWNTPLALRDLAEAIPIISDNGLPLLTENNFQTPFFIWTPCLLIFRLFVGTPFLLKPPYYLELESKKFIDPICTRIPEQVIYTNVIPCSLISDQDAPYILANISSTNFSYALRTLEFWKTLKWTNL